MWVFYMISLPLTLGMVILTLKYFAGPEVRRYVYLTVGYTWFCSISIIILVPADIWTTIIGHQNDGISFFWSWSYWSTFLLTWLAVPLIQGYEDAGDFTVLERLKTSIRVNLVFYLIVGSFGFLGLILLFTMDAKWHKPKQGILGFAMGCSNTFGLVTGAFLLGFGLSEIPKSLWRNADWTIRQKILSHKISKMALKLDDAHQDLSNVIVVAQATSKQMSKRDPLRSHMDVIDDMLVKMFKEDPSFKPQGGRLGENDMDYDTDEKSMATLRRHLRGAREEYYRCKSEYLTYVMEALELEDTIKNYERRSIIGWKFLSSFRPERSGKLGSFFDMTEFVWRCFLRKHLKKVFAIILGCMSAAILLAEATMLTSGVDLSLFSVLIKSVGNEEVLVQVCAFVPLMYMCVCTYYSLFKVGMLMFYSLTPKQTSSVSLLMICSMVARYAPPISYNFLNLINFDKSEKTIFEKHMGKIDEEMPFFGEGFNKIYPLIMVIYTILVASNFFDRIISFFCNWKIFKLHTEADDMDGFDPSGLLILQKGEDWYIIITRCVNRQKGPGWNKGGKSGNMLFHWLEISMVRALIWSLASITMYVIFPLADFLLVNYKRARKYHSTSPRVLYTTFKLGHRTYRFPITFLDNSLKMKMASEFSEVDTKGSSSKPLKDDMRRYSGSKEVISSKYAAIREQSKSTSNNTTPVETIASAKVSLLNDKNSHPSNASGVPPGLASKWASMKQGFQTFKANMEAKKLIPLRQVQETKLLTRASSSESLDEIFQRLKRPAEDRGRSSDDEEDDNHLRVSARNR